MANNIVTSIFQKFVASSVIDEFSSSPHFMVVGKHVPYEPDDNTVESPSSTPQQLLANTYNEMIFGKKITDNDVCLVVPRYDWTSGNVYSQYDHADPLLLTKEFFVNVSTGGHRHVYKCLFNNNGANSTVQPSGQDLEPFSSPTDGYVWKYMYSFSTAQHTKFSTDDYIPVIANTTIEAAAIPGTIEAVEVEESGTGYTNHFESSFRAQDIEVGGDDFVYGLTEDASIIDFFYRDCIIKITSGAGANQYRKIVDYQVGGGQNLITLESGFTIVPAATDTYQIYPAVEFTGDGQEVDVCVAWAIVDPDANDSIEQIEILDAGEGYRMATATVLADATVGVNVEASLRPIVSPALGHGHNPAEELGGNHVVVSVKFTTSEANTIPVDNDYRTIAILREPLFSNVHVTIDSFETRGTFTANEEVLNYREIPLKGTVALTSGSVTVTGTSTHFTDSVEIGTELLITDGTNNFYSNVASRANNTSLTVDANATFTNTGCTIALVTPVATASLVSANGSTLILDDVEGSFTIDNLRILGRESHTSTMMDDSASPIMSINDTTVNSFNTFIQVQKLTGTLSGVTEFNEDETLTQASTESTGLAFSFENATPDILYVSGIVGSFNMGSEIVGEDSAAAFVPSNKYPGALKIDSGKLVYLENIAPVTRQSNKSETFKVVLEF